jgi:hypothetical protein
MSTETNNGEFRLNQPVTIRYATTEEVDKATEEFVSERAELIWRLSKT